MCSDIVYLNGQYLPLAEAKISVLDRGFLFGDGVYEVIPAYNGHLFRPEEHLQRLNNSLDGIRLPLPYSYAEWLEILNPLLNPGEPDQSVYLQITRGAAPKRDHAFPENVAPTVFAMCTPIKYFAGKEAGVKAFSVEDNRWQLCRIKAITLLANVLLRQHAVDHGCEEALLVKNGFVTEGAASNVFAVLDGVLTTPPKDNAILPGITRDVIVEIAQREDIPVAERPIPVAALENASEVWFSSSTREIMPVVEIDGRAVGDGKPGPLFRRMNTLFQQFKRSV
ncbi:MAG: D-amino acid aminotransferase [Gammaproteobacteria bacterium]